MAAALRTAAREPHHNERWGADFIGLAAVCEAWSPAQAFAVLDAITRTRQLSAGWVEAVRATGLWRPQPLIGQPA